MWEVLERQPSHSDYAFDALNKLMEAAGQYQQNKSQQLQGQKQLEQENKAFLNMGIDLRGVTDPRQRQQIMASALQGKNLREVEMLKQQGKRGLLEEKKSYLDKVLGGQNERPQMQEDLKQTQQQYDPSKISDADIARATAIDPTLGRELRAAKDTALREQREERKFKEKQKRKISRIYKRERINRFTSQYRYQI